MSEGNAEDSEMKVIICEPTKYVPPGISPSIASIISIQPAISYTNSNFKPITITHPNKPPVTNAKLKLEDDSSNNTSTHSTIIGMLETILENQNQMKAAIKNLQKDVTYIKKRIPNQRSIVDGDGRIYLTNKVCGKEEPPIQENFPLNTVNELNDLETRLQDPKYAERITSHLRIATLGSDLDDVFRSVITDQACINYNLDGWQGKFSLYALTLFKKIIFDIRGTAVGRQKYERELRKSILKSHNRYHKAKGAKKNKKKISALDVSIKNEPEVNFE